jgi:hypothetical protein
MVYNIRSHHHRSLTLLSILDWPLKKKKPASGLAQHMGFERSVRGHEMCGVSKATISIFERRSGQAEDFKICFKWNVENCKKG